MDVPLPFQTFSGDEERKLFAKMMIEQYGPVDDVTMALEWCKLLIPARIYTHAKLPCHIRVERANYDKKTCIRDMMKESKRGMEALKEMNTQVSPILVEASGAEKTDESCNSDESISTQATIFPLPNTVGRKRKAAAVGLHHTLVEPALPSHFQAPPPQALHNSTIVQCGMTIGNIPFPKPGPERNQVCTRCRQFGGMNAFVCTGRNQHRYCKYFEKNGNPKCFVEPQRIRAPKKCSLCYSIQCKGRGNRKLCPHYVDSNR